MANEMVMRSIYLRPEEDAALRQLAFEIEVTKSDLIRSAISAKLEQWLESDSTELVLKDVELGKRPSRADRAKAARADAEKAPQRSDKAPVKASAKTAPPPNAPKPKAGGGDTQQGQRTASKKVTSSRLRNGGHQVGRTSGSVGSKTVAASQREAALAD